MQLRPLLRLAIDGAIKNRRPGSYSVYELARRIVQAYENNDVDMRSNGEHWVQSRVLAGPGTIVAFDVGANQGEWAKGLLERVPDCHVYCFEPVPTTFAKLQENVRDSRVQFFNMALSSAEGTLAINSVIDNSYISSVHDVSLYHPDARIEKKEVPASTGDRQIADLGLSHVDILKVDAEGHDLDVLIGFKAALDAELIDIIQFEYNVFTLAAKHSLRDFFDVLGKNYLVCRLLPTGLEACGYHSSLDDFRQTNWVAVLLSTIDRKRVKELNILPARGLPADALDEALSSFPHVHDALGLQ